MTGGLVDTTVILHYFRREAAARAWVDAQPSRLSIASITWMEVMVGVSSKSNQAQCKAILNQFQTIYLIGFDQQWAMQQLETHQFSYHIGMNDCLIASVAYRLQVPLYTHNLKDMKPLIGNLAVQPY